MAHIAATHLPAHKRMGLSAGRRPRWRALTAHHPGRPPSITPRRAIIGPLCRASDEPTPARRGDQTMRGRSLVMAVAIRRKVQYKDLREYLNLLDRAGLLSRIAGEVDLKHEIGAICAYGLERGGPGLLFENVKGYPGKSLVSNIIYTVEQLALVFNTEPDIDRLYAAIVEGHRNRVPSVVLDSGPCKEEKFVG